jgi:tRNA/rRNA methyltransferase
MDELAALAGIRAVLCEPSHPGNIGAAARALKTMGLVRLDLVRPRAFPHPDADARASGALDVLHAARCHDSLDAALAGTTLVCGLSARRRDLTPEVVDARTAAREIVAHARNAEAAIVFGPERVGLSIEALSRCQRLVRIPANPDYPSLNLAASVQVMAYELRCASAEAGAGPLPQGSPVQPASHEEVERLVRHLEQTMRATGFLHPERPGRLVQRMRRLLARARPEPEEVAILRGFLRSITEREPRG